MALELDSRYPGRFNPGNADYPQGSFKNRTAPGALDGSYLEKDWANDKEGFFQRLLLEASITPNGDVDTALASQYYEALIKAIQGNSLHGGFQVITSSTSFIVPDSVFKLKYKLWGGGGGGGGVGSTGAGGAGGGGSGGYSEGVLDVTPGQSITVTIGAAGTAGAAGTPGGTGGTTTLTISAVIVAAATGGSGGAANGTGGAGGSAGAGTVGTLLLSGGTGGTTSGAVNGIGGLGANPPGGAVQGAGFGQGGSGRIPGGGGAGTGSQLAAAGGAGARGQVNFEW